MTAGAGLALKVFQSAVRRWPTPSRRSGSAPAAPVALRIGDNQAPQAVHPEAVRIVGLPNLHHHIGEGLAIGNPVQRILFQSQRMIVAIAQGKTRRVLAGIGPRAF